MHVRPNPKVGHYPLFPDIGVRVLGHITGRGEYVGSFSAVPSVLRGRSLLDAPDRIIGNFSNRALSRWPR